MRLWVVAVFIVLLGAPSSGMTAKKLSSYAFINDDGTLRIKGRTVHLFGIFIPPTNKICRTYIIPIRCGSRASLDLEFKIDGHFVHCQVMHKNPDRSLVAVCEANGVDLAAYLLGRGWAVALPEAPPRYGMLERAARSRGLGVWGTPVDGRVVR